MKTRAERIIGLAGLHENEAIYLTKPSNIFYVSGYTGEGAALIGLAASISSSAFLIGQVIGGAYLHRVRSQLHHMLRMAVVSRVLMLILAAALWLGLRGPAAAWLFLLLYTVFLLTDGVVGLCWTQISARTLPPSMLAARIGAPSARPVDLPSNSYS